MEISKAYELVVDTAIGLREEGIDLKITPSNSEESEEEGGLPRDKWIRLEFFVETKAQAKSINQKTKEFNWRGISFDTSGHPGQRQWDLDWSFEVTDGPDAEWERDGDEVEDMIDEMERSKDDSQKG